MFSVHAKQFHFSVFFLGGGTFRQNQNLMVGLAWGVARFGVPQEVLGVQKSTQHHEHHQTDCQWTSTREFDISLERAWLSGHALSCPI